MWTFIKKMAYEPALFFAVTTAVLATAAGIWSSDILAFTAAAFAVAGGIVTRNLTTTNKTLADNG